MISYNPNRGEGRARRPPRAAHCSLNWLDRRPWLVRLVRAVRQAAEAEVKGVPSMPSMPTPTRSASLEAAASS